MNDHLFKKNSRCVYFLRGSNVIFKGKKTQEYIPKYELKNFGTSNFIKNEFRTQFALARHRKKLNFVFLLKGSMFWNGNFEGVGDLIHFIRDL